MILLLSLATQQKAIEKMKPDSSQKCTMSRMETNYNMGNFENILGKKIRRRLSKPETGVAELLWNLHPCRSSKLSSGNLIQTASTLSLYFGRYSQVAPIGQFQFRLSYGIIP